MESQPEPNIWKFPVELQLLGQEILWRNQQTQKIDPDNCLQKYPLYAPQTQNFHMKYTIEYLPKYTLQNNFIRCKIPFVQYLMEYPIE